MITSDRDGRIGQHVDDGGPHVVVPMRRTVGMLMLPKTTE